MIIALDVAADGVAKKEERNDTKENNVNLR